MIRRIRVFISSPGDVVQERVVAQRVLQNLDLRYACATIEPILWEHEPLLATDDFQSQIPRPSEADIVVCILWSRLGSRLPPQHVRSDGTTYASGTEYEFEDAYQQWCAERQPELLVYQKLAEPQVSLGDIEAARAAIQQKEALDHFIDKWFHDKGGTLIAAKHEFADVGQFEALLEEHLVKLIERRFQEGGVDPSAVAAARELPRISWEGSPFRGLQVFESEHARIFFGRTRAIGEVLDMIRRQVIAERAFCLLLGPSGCGKSSLMRAGVLPMLGEAAVVEGVGLWRSAVCLPSDADANLLTGLAVAMLQPAALPELASDGTTAEQFADMLRRKPDYAAGRTDAAIAAVGSTLRTAKEAKYSPEARLIIVIDQLEEIFTDERITESERQAFLRALGALVASKGICVLATLRNDFYDRAGEVLIAMGGQHLQYDLQPPTMGEIGQLIRLPASMAGLEFEVHPKTQARLDDVLRDDAGADIQILPLLQYALEQLYERRRGRFLTHDAYQELGGIAGAVSRKADEALGDFVPEAQQELDDVVLPAIFRPLVTISGYEDRPPTRRTAHLDSVRAQPESRQLVDALIAARLLTTDRSADGSMVVRVAHEALLTSWEPMKRWLKRDRELLRIRSRVASAVALWDEKEDPDFLLPAGSPLEDARRLVASGFDLTKSELAFIDASARRAKRRSIVRRVAVAGIATLLLLTAGLSTLAYLREKTISNLSKEKTEAESDRADAEAAKAATEKEARLEIEAALARETKARVEAETQERAARRSQYGTELLQAWNGFEDSRIESTKELLAKQVPTTLEDFDFRHLEWRLLQRELAADLRTLTGHEATVPCVAFAPDGKRIISGDWGGLVKVWDSATGESVPLIVANTGEEIGDGTPHRDRVRTLAHHPDGPLFVSGDEVGNIIIWSFEDSEGDKVQIGGLPSEDENAIWGLAFSPDGSLLAACMGSGTIRLWDFNADDTREFGGHEGVVHSIAFSPDSSQLASVGVDRTLRVRDVVTGNMIHNFELGEGLLRQNAVAFHPRGNTLAAADGRLLVLWDLETGEKKGELDLWIGDASQVYCVAFSPDGLHLAVGNMNRTIALFALDGPQSGLKAILKGHDEIVECVAFSPDGRRLVSSDGEGIIKIWDVYSGNTDRGPLVLKPGAHDGARDGEQAPRFFVPPVSDMEFSDDGRKVVLSYGSFAPNTVLDDSERDDQLDPYATIDVHDTLTGRVLVQLTGHTDEVTGVAFGNHDQWIASSSKDGTARLWNAETGEQRMMLSPSSGALIDVAFSPDSQRVATAGADGLVRLWNAESGQQQRTFSGHEGEVASVSFSPDGRQMISGGVDHTVRLYDVASGEQIRTFDSATGMVRSVAFRPDGKWIAAGGGGGFPSTMSGELHIWNVADETELEIKRPHARRIDKVVYSDDGKRLITAGGDTTVRLWDATSGQLLRVFGPRQSPFDSQTVAAISKAGDRFAFVEFPFRSRVLDARPLTPEVRVQREAAGLTHFWFELPLEKRDVIEFIQSDNSITAEVRSTALQFAEQYHQATEADDYGAAAMNVLGLLNANSTIYEILRRQAAAAVRREEKSSDYLNALGVAEYRCDRLDNAIKTLEKYDQIDPAATRPSALACLTMAHARLGNEEAAATALARLEKAAKEERWADNSLVRNYLYQVYRVLEAESRSPF